MYKSEFTEATTSCSESSPLAAVTKEAMTSFSLSVHSYALSLSPFTNKNDLN